MTKIEGQVIYLGPMARHYGLYYGKLWRNGVHDASIYRAIEACPPIRSLIVPVDQCAHVLGELAFDYAHNMCGRHGQYPTFYLAVQQWIATTTKTQPKPSGVTLQTTHA